MDLENPDLARTVYARAEARISSASDLSKLAQAVANDLQDKDFSAQIYERAAENLVAPNDLINLASDIYSQLQGTVRAASVYGKASEKDSDFKQLLKLLDQAFGQIKDEGFARQGLEKAASPGCAGVSGRQADIRPEIRNGGRPVRPSPHISPCVSDHGHLGYTVNPGRPCILRAPDLITHVSESNIHAPQTRVRGMNFRDRRRPGWPAPSLQG